MRSRLLALLVMIGALPVAAHLCNDVFVQAKDNLAVKVDIRDGQLRIGEEGSFRVYLLNTMDRDIVAIDLEVLSDQFSGTVKPGADWKSFPYLKTSKKGGGKVHFEVRLRRNPDVADGTYKINLRLFNRKQRSMEFKTVDLNAAAAMHSLPTGTAQIDGKANREEWQGSVLCADFYEYVRAGRYFENKTAADQCRIRVKADAQYLYCLFSFQASEAERDTVTVYAAAALDGTPKLIHLDRRTLAVRNPSGDIAGVEVMPTTDGAMLECRIPRQLLGIASATEFYLNFTRTMQRGASEQITYWRGNQHSVQDPVVYAKFQHQR